MNNDSPPRSDRPAAGGEFTWPPTSEELEAIQVIPLDDTSAPRASLLPAPLEASALPVAAPAIKRRRRRLRPPRRDDLLYLGVTFASTLAIAVAATSQLSDWDWRHMLSQHIARSDAPPTPRQTASSAATPPAADTSSAADLAVLRLLAAPPDVADAALAATPAPLAALAKEARPAAPLKKIRDARVRRAPRTTQRAASHVADRRRLATRASTAAIPVSTAAAAAYVRPRLISPEAHGRRGKLVLWVEVKKNGKVGDVDVLSSDLDRSQRSQRDLQRAAISTVKKWRYTPAMRDGEPTDTRVRVVVDINLDSSRVFHTTEADARRTGAAANRVADSVRAAR